MSTINSVLGPLDTDNLGFTLCHEHVLTTSAGIHQAFPEFIDRRGTIEVGIAQLKQAYAEGVRTIVDVTTMDLGRDIRVLEEISRGSGVQIIAATGIWLDIPRVFWGATPDMIAPLFVREIREGIEGTNIKAGVIKVANDRGGVTPQGEIILRAAARAQKATDVPISTHTWALERVGEQQVRIFEEEGVDLSRVYIGHSNNTTDVEYLLGLLRKGILLGLDQYPGGRTPGTPNWEQRTEIAMKLVQAGFGEQIMLSHDWGVGLHLANWDMQEQRAQNNPDGYLFITRRVIPRLKELGATDKDIENIFVNNPRSFFSDER